MKKIHLLCNAHLDPVWLWRRTEGMAEAMATFRIAADFCEKYDGFVFNHNEAVLYEWISEHDPKLFERIKKLVKDGKWVIMGGWYLQPDEIMPSGEAIIRQISVGKAFFEKHFGVFPKTAMSFDAFGHSRGLVQILKKCGYENYAYMLPRDTECRPFVWEGFDGSKINAFKLFEWYNTPKGHALERIKEYIEKYPERQVNLITWGIGNHGGGPSEKDLNDINNFIRENKEYEIVHSDFDSYFSELDDIQKTVSQSLMHCMVGCYTSLSRIKQGYRSLENKLEMCERMLCQSGITYDAEELKKAEKALLFTQFHDILPGTAIKKAEQDNLNLLGYGDEIAEKLSAAAFFKLCSGQAKAKENEIPVVVYNPHPFAVEGDFEVEFNLAAQNYADDMFINVKVRDESGGYVPAQNEKPDCTMNWDWRKKVVFHANLKPMGITRFDCELAEDYDYVKIKPYAENDTHIILSNDKISVHISKKTGLIDKYCENGSDVINGISLKTYKDNEDPWGMTVDGFNDYSGDFTLLCNAEANKFRGYSDENIPNVSVIENGDVRTKVQAIFGFEHSYAIITYIFSKNENYVDIDVKMLVNEPDMMFKLCVDTALDKSAQAYGQQMFGTEKLRNDGNESPFQKWSGLFCGDSNVCVLNRGNYGGSAKENMLYVNLLRTAVYSAHPNELGRPIAPHDRVHEHIDMGEHDFSFRICTNAEYPDTLAEVFNKAPYVLSFFPSGEGEKPSDGLTLDNRHILLSGYKKHNDGALLRLYNSSSESQNCRVSVCNNMYEISFGGFEVKTFAVNGNLTETNMLGE